MKFKRIYVASFISSLHLITVLLYNLNFYMQESRAFSILIFVLCVNCNVYGDTYNNLEHFLTSSPYYNSCVFDKYCE